MTTKPDETLPENWRAIKNCQNFAPPETATVRIVCAAAIYRESGVVFAGPRHCDNTMWKQVQAAGFEGFYEMEQGFIDQWGRFWNRRQAMQICEIEGQPVNFSRQGNVTDHLFSEGLY